MRGYWKSFLALFGAGMIGVASLFPTMRPTAEVLLSEPGAPPISVTALQLVLLVNPTLLLLVGVAVGTALAPRLGLRSHLAEKARGAADFFPALRPELLRALLWGVASAVIMLALDALFRPLLGAGGESLRAAEAAQPRTFAVTLMGMLYGGITEELVMRWGLMAFLAWLLWRIAQRGTGRPRDWIGWSVIVVAAVLFGAGHLGVVAAQGVLTGAMVVRTIAVNAVGGMVFGWLFWRHSLEAAMVAHASVHVVFTVAAWAGGLVGTTLL